PPGGTKVNTYSVFRDGTIVTTVTAPTTTYTDTNVSPGRAYTYEVDAQSGKTISGKVSVQVTTPVPKLTDGRLAGVFNLKAHVISSSGFASLNSNITLGWRLTPKCSSGACNVGWAEIGQNSFKGTFKRNKGSYS